MHLTEIQKFEIIIKHNEGFSIREIAKHMNINKNTVYTWITRYKNEGNVNKKKKVGKIRGQLNNQ
jgi:transposase